VGASSGAPTSDTKICSRCNEERLATTEFFSPRQANYDGLNGICRDCINERYRLRYHADPEKFRDKTRSYRLSHAQTPEQKEIAAARTRQWRRDNPERALENDRRKALRNPDLYAQRHLDRTRKRQAKLKGVTVSPVERQSVIERHGMWCYLCETAIRQGRGKRGLHIDHVIPLERGGPHCMENLRPTHAECNQLKGTKLLAELTLPFKPPKVA
jgi:5-methylcytosine-specific restriction endonuclease McrA